MKSLYSNLNLMSMVSALNEHFAAYFHEATRPMRSLLRGIVLAMLAFESIPSIRWMHRRFHLSLMPGSLNSYYRALKTCTVDDSSWVSHTIRMALSAIPSDLADAPLFLSVDDTIVAKAGQCFDFVSKLFDHAMQTGSAYVNGHCFVSLMLSVPVDKDMKGGCSGGICYLHVPVVYCLWTKEKTKLEMAADAIDAVYERKTFWSLGRYMLRRRCGIERLLNLICMAHASMRLLPYVDTRFTRFKECSPQEVRMAISKQIQDELFLSRLADEASNTINSADILSVLRDMVKHWNNAA